MDDGVYLEKLSAFSRLLRLKGLTVGPAETADAAQVLTTLGLADRQTVKTALRTVYASSREEQLTFDGVFDGFFISEEAMRRQAQEQMRQEQAMEERRREAEEKGLDAEKAKQICIALLLYAHGMAAMQATGRTAFTHQQIEANMHAMHEMLLAQTK